MLKPSVVPLDTLLKYFNTNSEQGLSQGEAKKLLQAYGLNKLREKKKESIFVVFIHQFQNPLIYILLFAASIIFFLGNYVDAFVISGILFFNAIIGAIQEGRAENMLEGLQQYLKAQSLVIRDGKKMIISDELLVPGDIVLFQEGEKVTADARLIESQDLLVDESMLTGESKPIKKSSETMEKEVSIADQINMVFKGTYILSGTGKALVVATGNFTEIGKIGHVVETIETDMPLKREIDTLSHWILYCIFALCLFLFFVGFFQGRSIPDLLVMLTALFICVIPEGLPVVLTLTLVTGAFRMAKEHILVKKLQATEGLGRTNVIVIDKTGTLTRNEMIVSKVFSDDKVFEVTGQGYRSQGEIFYQGTAINRFDQAPKMHTLAQASALLNDAEIECVVDGGLCKIKGDPTEAAMVIFSKKIGFEKQSLHTTYQPLIEFPFQADVRYQVGFYSHGDTITIFMLGAPEVIIEKSGGVSEMTATMLQQLLNEGFRVIAGAVKELNKQDISSAELTKEGLQKFLTGNFTFLGLLAIEDTIRPEVARIIQESRKAGLKVVMATGDHKGTALFVAKKVGIFTSGDVVIDGSEFKHISDQELLKQLYKITVFSRVTPEHKLRIIHLFKQKGNIVAMTGDGVNDAPSLVAADIGIAMGIIGTEVAKQAADLILLDDSFASIIKALEQGRHIFNILRRVIMYFFTTNMAEVLIILFALVYDVDLPLLAVQILWLNLVTDGFLNVALSMEPVQEKLNNTIIKSSEHLVDFGVFIKMAYLSLPMAAGSFALFLYYQSYGISYARTMTLVTMALYQWMNVWNCRSENQSIFQIGFFTNIWLVFATLFVFGLQIALLYVPFLQVLYKTVPIGFEQWMVILAVTVPLFILEELRKAFGITFSTAREN